ncbi:MAG: metallophosphoesterase [Bacteroidales bacterium]|nr:metallophosphoesterase [Bacteroidales bacterium]
MKILHLSDTHGCHRRLKELPEADVVVHSGDFCMDGTEKEVIDFINWFCDLPYDHKIFICGNHDEYLYESKIDGLDDNVHYLCNSGIEIDGINFYGVPMFMGDCITDRFSYNYSRITADTDVLITHCPAYGILDSDDNINYGSWDLLARLLALDLKAHLFGHIHARHDIVYQNGVIYSNGAIMNSNYSSIQFPNVLEI